MEGLHFDPKNSDHLTQAWLFIEHFNVETAEKIRSGKIGPIPDRTIVEADSRDRGDHAGWLQTLLLTEREYLSNKQATWSKHLSIMRSSAWSEAESENIFPSPNPQVIDAVVESLLFPAKVERQPDGQWKLNRRSNLPKATLPDRLRESLWLYPVRDSLSFASREVLPGSLARTRNTWGLFWEEALDPILVIQNLLMTIIDTQDVENANFYLQRWLRRKFAIRYDDLTKYSISRVARQVNKLFYSRGVPSRDEIHVARSTSLGLQLFIHQILSVLEEAGGKEENNQRLSLGIYLFLRFCRVLRCRYFWPAPLDAEGAQSPWLEKITETQCVSALRPAEYSYLLARMFGAITDIPGLTFVFRGGVLPRPESGRTMLVLGPPGAGKTVFALQKLVSIASRGGLSIYFSFEESYELIFDRLVTFGFVDYSKFDIKGAGKEAGELVRIFRQKHLGRGLLILYGNERREGFDLPAVIRKIADAANDCLWKWRALAVDSVNAIEALPQDGIAGNGLRTTLNKLINTIEDQSFLGVVLGEKDREGYESLPYLADTVIELGFYESKRMRWIEVNKCRSQNFHPGCHPCRITEGKGLRIYPSLPAIQSSLRRRMNSTLSAHRVLKLEHDLKTKDGEVVKIHEKSSVLLCGAENSGKTRYALELAQASLERHDSGLSLAKAFWKHPTNQALEEPSSALVINFRTTERRFRQNLVASSLHGWWTRLKYQRTRWYSPGENVAPAQVVADVWNYIKESRRQGAPLQRIVFDELESAEHVLPMLQREPLFWGTLLQLVNTEAITAIFVVGGKDYKKSKVFNELKIGVDYIVVADGLRVQKRPELIGPVFEEDPAELTYSE